MAPIRVVVNGATGKMGTETVGAINSVEDLELVGAVCRRERGPALSVPGGSDVPLSIDLSSMLESTRPDVLVDFTNAAACMEAAMMGAARSTNLVLGASGLTDDNLQQLDAVAHDKGIGIVVAPNFALGAVVLKKLAEQAAAYFDYVDIVEAHHEAKIDAPLGLCGCPGQEPGRPERVHQEPDRERKPARRPGRRIQRRNHPQHTDAGTQRAPRSHHGSIGPDHLPEA